MKPKPSANTERYKKEIGMMNLEELIEEREFIPSGDFPVPLKQVLARYEQLYAGLVSDVLREFCLLDQSLPGYIKPLRDADTVAGVAFTVKSAPNVLIRGEMKFRTEMLDEMEEDSFVVWDTSGDEKATLWGGVMTATAREKKLRAACIDGGIRDTRQILAADFPVYYKYRCPNGSLSRCLITHYQVPIQIGDVVIRPGDIIFADLDGVVCVPRGFAYAVLERAEELSGVEKEIFGWVKEGLSIDEITNRGGYF